MIEIDRKPLIKSIYQSLERAVLAALYEAGASTDYCIANAPLREKTGLNNGQLKPILKELRDKGFIFHANGLSTDSGEFAGSGHALTASGQAALGLSKLSR